MTNDFDLQSLKTFAKRLARVRRVAHHVALDLVASTLRQPHWNALTIAWARGWQPEDDAIDALASIDEATDPVMDIPMLGISEGIEELGELDGHPYSLHMNFEVIMAQISHWAIVLGHAPSARPMLEVYDFSDANPIFDSGFRAKALAIAQNGADRVRARISADWPRRSTKPDAEGQAEHPLSKGVSNEWHCLHCDSVASGTQMAENMWHCPVCSASPIDIFVEPFWKSAS